MDLARLSAFGLAALLVELTPGPNMGFLALVAARRGWRAGVAVVAGATLGLTVYMLAAAFGLARLLLAERGVYEALRWAGVAYIAWLAVDAWREASSGGARPPYLSGDFSPFLRGLVANLLNVKAALFYVAVLPDFIDQGAGDVLAQALQLGALHLAISIVIHGAIVGGATGLGSAPWARVSRVAAGRAFAVGLGLTAAWLAWTTRG